MSSQTAEVVRRSFELWNERRWDEWKALHHPDVLAIPPDGWPDGEVIRDIDGWFAQAMRLSDPWEGNRLEVEDQTELGDGRVLTVFRWITLGKDSGVGLETQLAQIARARDGRIAELAFFLNREAALEAAGLTA